MSLLKYAIASALVLVGFATFLFPLLKQWLSAMPKPNDSVTVLKRKDVNRSSDAPAPAGLGTYIALLRETAPTAGPDVLLQYAEEELTEAEVAIAEAKLARQAAIPQNNSTVVAFSK
jgi:hypothetical protein